MALGDWGSIASLVGVGFSAGAFWKAWVAARDARDASALVGEVRKVLAKRTVAEDLASVEGKVREVCLYIRAGNAQAAYALIAPCERETRLIVARWDTVLDNIQKNCLNRTVKHLGLAGQELSGATIDTDGYARARSATEQAQRSMLDALGIASAQTYEMG